jgi:hypothetical protein
MKTILRGTPQNFRVESVSGFTPKDMICEAPLMPDGSVCTDVSIIDLVLVEESLPGMRVGPETYIAVVNPEKLKAKDDREALAKEKEEQAKLASVARAKRIKDAYRNADKLTLPEIKDLLKNIIEHFNLS